MPATPLSGRWTMVVRPPVGASLQLVMGDMTLILGWDRSPDAFTGCGRVRSRNGDESHHDANAVAQTNGTRHITSDVAVAMRPPTTGGPMDYRLVMGVLALWLSRRGKAGATVAGGSINTRCL